MQQQIKQQFIQSINSKLIKNLALSSKEFKKKYEMEKDLAPEIRTQNTLEYLINDTKQHIPESNVKKIVPVFIKVRGVVNHVALVNYPDECDDGSDKYYRAALLTTSKLISLKLKPSSKSIEHESSSKSIEHESSFSNLKTDQVGASEAPIVKDKQTYVTMYENYITKVGSPLPEKLVNSIKEREEKEKIDTEHRIEKLLQEGNTEEAKKLEAFLNEKTKRENKLHYTSIILLKNNSIKPVKDIIKDTPTEILKNRGIRNEQEMVEFFESAHVRYSLNIIKQQLEQGNADILLNADRDAYVYKLSDTRIQDIINNNPTLKNDFNFCPIFNTKIDEAGDKDIDTLNKDLEEAIKYINLLYKINNISPQSTLEKIQQFKKIKPFYHDETEDHFTEIPPFQLYENDARVFESSLKEFFDLPFMNFM